MFLAYVCCNDFWSLTQKAQIFEYLSDLDHSDKFFPPLALLHKAVIMTSTFRKLVYVFDISSFSSFGVNVISYFLSVVLSYWSHNQILRQQSIYGLVNNCFIHEVS